MYAKVFRSIYYGSLRNEPDARDVFVCLLAHVVDRKGSVDMTPEVLASIMKRPLSLVESALAVLEAPDPESASPEEDGRRLTRTSTGWFIVNYEKYRDIRNEESRRELNRVYKRTSRARQHMSAPVSKCQHIEKHTHTQSHKQKQKDLPSGEGVSLFDRFYTNYPRKVGKLEAVKAWKSKRISSQEDLDRIMKGLERWKQHWAGKEPEFIPYPATWLRGNRWEDDPGQGAIVAPGASNAVSGASRLEAVKAEAKRWAIATGRAKADEA